METEKLIIKISTDFTDSPGARDKVDGSFSGEEFYTLLLKPKFDEAIKKNVKLSIDLDGVWGYPSSFISGSFGRLVSAYDYDKVFDTIDFISEDNQHRIADIKINSKNK